jgi:predicted amidophosphoribosyltransferase
VGVILIFITGPLGFVVGVLGVLLLLFNSQRKCWRCGATWRKGQVYCAQCGAKLEAP